jgi:hypothetical protein
MIKVLTKIEKVKRRRKQWLGEINKALDASKRPERRHCQGKEAIITGVKSAERRAGTF